MREGWTFRAIRELGDVQAGSSVLRISIGESFINTYVLQMYLMDT